MGNMTQYSYAGSPGCPSCEAGGGSAAIPSKINDPLGNISLLSSDKAGKVTGVRDRNNNVTASTYDKSGRLTKITYPDGKSETYTYGGGVRLCLFAFDANYEINTIIPCLNFPFKKSSQK